MRDSSSNCTSVEPYFNILVAKSIAIGEVPSGRISDRGTTLDASRI